MINWNDDIRNLDFTYGERGPERLEIGQRIAWWYQEDVDFANDDLEFTDFDSVDDWLMSDPPYSGVVVPVEDTEDRGGGYYVEYLVVVMDKYPVEKCYCEATWIAYKRLLKNPEIVKVVGL